jgi:long-chain acyl-CoA synthetase
LHYQELKTAWDELTAPGAPFELVVQEVRGAPLKVFKNAPPNVRAIWLSTAAFADRTYLVFENERITYAEAHILVASIANWLHAHGVKRGDRVAIAMRNFPEWMLIYWACVSVGVTVVGMNAWWTAEEMSYGFKDAQPKVAFVDPERMARIAERPEMVEGISLVAVDGGLCRLVRRHRHGWDHARRRDRPG